MSDYRSRLVTALISARQSEWRGYTHHPFVQQLGAGTLPKAAFLHYLRQDYVFLIHFARAWALAVVKSDRISEMRIAAGTVHALIDEEMKLHVATCAEEGISEQDLAATRESPANLAYTRFVMDAGLKGDLLELLVALAPCVFGYGEIGLRLAKKSKDPPSGHPYRDWIATYSGEDYQSVCGTVGRLVDEVAERTIGEPYESSPRWPGLTETFATASRLEADFWQMGLDGS
jgi:thiaminase/transcriptional activator TenA